MCEIPLLFCFVARKYSMLLKIILTESYPLLFYHSHLFLANSDKSSVGECLALILIHYSHFFVRSILLERLGS